MPATIWDALELSRWYTQYSWAIDSLIYLTLFAGIARVTVGQRFEGRGGVAISIATGLALTFGAATAATGSSTYSTPSGAALLWRGAPHRLFVDFARASCLADASSGSRRNTVRLAEALSDAPRPRHRHRTDGACGYG